MHLISLTPCGCVPLTALCCSSVALVLWQAFFNYRRKIEIFWLIWLIIITASATPATYLMWLSLFIFFAILFIADLMFLNDSFIYDPTANAQVSTA